jgi:hypothetical protein
MRPRSVGYRGALLNSISAGQLMDEPVADSSADLYGSDADQWRRVITYHYRSSNLMMLRTVTVLRRYKKATASGPELQMHS